MRLRRYLRGPDNRNWQVQFLKARRWQPRAPVSLSTPDQRQAMYRAHDTAAVFFQTGQIVPARTGGGPDPRVCIFAAAAVVALAAEEATPLGDTGNRRKTAYPHGQAVQIRNVITPKFNAWINDEPRVRARKHRRRARSTICTTPETGYGRRR